MIPLSACKNRYVEAETYVRIRCPAILVEFEIVGHRVYAVIESKRKRRDAGILLELYVLGKLLCLDGKLLHRCIVLQGYAVMLMNIIEQMLRIIAELTRNIKIHVKVNSYDSLELPQ